MKTYGQAKLVKSGGRAEWHITADPAVLMRLRRLFTGTDRRGKVIRVSDTMQSARDIAWVCERWPLEITPREHLESRASAHREAEEQVARMLAAGYTPREFAMALPPREYQRLAADMALRSRGLLVADEMGLGKTMSAICALTDPSARPALVVTLTHLPKQWEAELARFVPDLRVHRIREGAVYDIASFGRRKPKRSEEQRSWSWLPDTDVGRMPDVIVTSYSKLVKWADVLAATCRSVVFDEVQELRKRSTRGYSSQKYDAAKQISETVGLRIGLSATPIYNFGGEMYSILDVLSPGCLGTWEEFSKEWCEGEEDKARLIDPGAFGRWARSQGLMLRRTRSDVGRELPALTRSVQHVDTDAKPLEAIEGRAAELARQILAQDGRGMDKMQAAGELDWRLRQATGLAKAPHVADFVQLLIESGEKRVLVFAWHLDVYAVLEERLRKSLPMLRVVRYTGEQSTPAKEEAKRTFLADSPYPCVMLMSLRSGAGVDGLQKVCRTVVFAELDWSPGVHEQCAGRVHRDGQTDPVMAYYLISEAGSDPVISDVLGVKRGQIESLRDPDAPLVVQQADPDHIKRLAASLLARTGQAA